MRYASIRKLDTTNGKGIGVALFVQGCHFHCKDCFNESTWDFNGGKQFTSEDLKRIIEYLSAPYVTRFSILGGEPLCDENAQTVHCIIEIVKSRFPDIKIWLWTGYNVNFTDGIDNPIFGEEPYLSGLHKRCALNLVDVLVDGRFKIEQKDLSLNYCGSRNQRVIDMNKSREKGEVVLYE